MNIKAITDRYMVKGVGGRQSIGLTRADNLRNEAKRVKARAESLGCADAAELADQADSCAFNSRNGYEAAQMTDRGGDSRAWALRSRGAMWLRKGKANLAKAASLMEPNPTPDEGREGEG